MNCGARIPISEQVKQALKDETPDSGFYRAALTRRSRMAGSVSAASAVPLEGPRRLILGHASVKKLAVSTVNRVVISHKRTSWARRLIHLGAAGVMRQVPTPCLMPLHPASSVAHWEPDTSYGDSK